MDWLIDFRIAFTDPSEELWDSHFCLDLCTLIKMYGQIDWIACRF